MRIKAAYQKFKSSFADPVFRTRALALVGGKVIGLTLVLSAMYVWLAPSLHAQAAAPAGPTPEMNALNTVWVLLAAFLVFCMQVGFVMLEAGFARSRESINILVEGIVDTCICGVTFWAWGFAFMFMDGNGFIGLHGWFLKGIPEVYGTTGVPLLAYWVFQFAFADTCSTITSGAMVGRCGFVGDILYSIGVTGFIYPIIGHAAHGLPDGKVFRHCLKVLIGRLRLPESERAEVSPRVFLRKIRRQKQIGWRHGKPGSIGLRAER